jgi:hypothetical protein
MNNFEKIKNMTLDEMAKYLTKLTSTYCEYCTFKEYCEDNEDDISCREVLKQWLQQESEG